MKNRLLYLFICLVMIFCTAGAFGGCAETDVPAQGGQGIVLYNFEQWGPDFQLCRISEGFGRVSPNTDTKYIKTGTQSCRLDPLAYLKTKKTATVYFPTVSDFFDYDYSDFLYVNSVRLEIYNPQTEDKPVEIGLVSRIISVTDFERTNKETFVLKSGWNTVNLFINGPIISASANISSIQGVYINFPERADSPSVTETTPRYYVDNISIIKKEAANETEFNLEFDENEFINFERFYHQYFLINEFDAELDIVKASDYGINATSGTKVLRLLTKGNNTGSWNYYVKIPASYVKATALNNLSSTDFQRAYFCYESYNNYKGSINVCALFFIDGKTSYYVNNGHAEAGDWTRHRIKLTDIEAGLSGWRNNMGMFVFSIRDTGTDDREFFFDNFRIELD